jgi:hypothetical protein
MNYCLHEDSKNIYKSNIYIDAALTGIIRSLIGLVFEHPLESIKTQWQNKINYNKVTEIVKSIYLNKGIMGFYRGFLPNVLKNTTKQIYRWPSMVYFPDFYQRTLSVKILEKYESLPRVLTGIYQNYFSLFDFKYRNISNNTFRET